MLKKEKSTLVEEKAKEDQISKYESPKIVTYTRDEILAEVGPAQACTTAPTCPITV